MAPAVVLCEGKSDEAFVEALIRSRGIPDIEVQPRNPKSFAPGVAGFGKRLQALKIDSVTAHRKGIVLLADNDLDPSNLFRSVVCLINQATEYLAPTGVWVPSARGKFPPIHIVNMPSRGSQGCIEHLWLSSAECAYPRITACIDGLLACLITSSWSANNIAKLKLRCLVASALSRDPTLSIEKVWYDDNGHERKVIPLNHTCFDPLADYLANL